MWSRDPTWLPHAMATWAPRRGTPDCIEARAWNGLSVDRAKIGALTSPSSITTVPSAANTTAEPMWRDSTKPLRSMTASSTAESTVKVACGFKAMLQVYGAGC